MHPRRRHLTRMTLVVSVLFGVSACYFTTDVSSLSGGAAEPTEGGSGGPDALADIAVADVSDPSDAGDDGPPMCAAADFCDGFERAAVIGSWDTTELALGGALSITAHAKTGARALRVSISPQDSTTAYLTRLFGAGKAVSFAYSMFMTDSPVRDVTVAPFAIDYPGNRENVLFVQMNGGQLFFVEQELVGGTQSFYKASPPVPVVLNRWVDVRITIDLSSVPARAVMTYGATEVFNGSLARQWAPGAPRMIAGSTYATAGTATAIDIDDVVVRITPP